MNFVICILVELSENVAFFFCSVTPNLADVAQTQFVLFNHSSSLWCPAEGGPAPHIVWRKNGAVVQNSTSVRYPLTITEEENNSSYSCEVDSNGRLDKKTINLLVESKFVKLHFDFKRSWHIYIYSKFNFSLLHFTLCSQNNSDNKIHKILGKYVYVIGLHAVQFGNNWMKTN